MELTWITFPTIVVTVSLLAYYAAYAVKGNDLRVNKVDVVDVDQAAGPGRGAARSSRCSARRTATTTSAVVPLPLDRDAPAAGRVAASRRGRRPGPRSCSSWFGVPETGFGGMGGEQPVRLRRAAATPTSRPGGAEALEGSGSRSGAPSASPPAGSARPGARWSRPTSCRSGPTAWPGPSPTAWTSRCEDAILAFGKQVYLLGTIAPGATVRVELTRTASSRATCKSKHGQTTCPTSRGTADVADQPRRPDARP